MALALGASADTAVTEDVSAAPASISPEAIAPEVAAPTAKTRFDRVVVAPLNVAVRAPEELEGKGDPVWQEMLRYFQQRDRDVAVLNGISAERLWLQATRDLDLSDRSAALRTGYSRFAQELARHREYDLLVVPTLVLRPGYLSGWQASWDGVHREVPHAAELMSTNLSDLSSSGTIHQAGLAGKVAGISLHVSLLRPDGTEVFQGLGGIDVLKEAKRTGGWDDGVQFVNRSEPFSDAGFVREGVERAFAEPIRTTARRW